MYSYLRHFFIFLFLATLAYADVFITEIADPNNNFSARYVELYNNGTEAVDLSTGWALQRWTNDNTEPQSPVSLTGTILAGDFYVVCSNGTEFLTVYGFAADQDIGTAGPADSNGDDNIALLDASSTIVDLFGVPGEDGSGTDHEFEDGRAERVATVTSGSNPWVASEWDIDNDSGGGAGPQDAPSGFDPAAWIGSGADAAPSISQVAHSPLLPISSDAVTVTATMTDDNSLTSTLLKYNNGSGWVTTSMFDDGAHGDGAAGDDVFGAQIPSQGDGTTVNYYVEATDDAVQTTTHPADAPTSTYSYIIDDDAVQIGDVIINEIMYNSTSTDTEYVELYNTTDAAIDISHWVFKDNDDGHNFEFPEGTILNTNSYLVVCEDTNFVKEKYGITNLIGNLGFAFNNSGDAARLFNSTGVLMDNVAYDDADPWPLEPDGNGPSLELKNPLFDNSLAENWAASTNEGTPGAQNSQFTSSIESERSGSIIKTFRLYHNFPNPFNPSTTLKFDIPERAENLELAVYDILGKKITVLHSGSVAPGAYRATWNGLNQNGLQVPSGIYFAILKTDQSRQTVKMTLLK